MAGQSELKDRSPGILSKRSSINKSGDRHTAARLDVVDKHLAARKNPTPPFTAIIQNEDTSNSNSRNLIDRRHEDSKQITVHKKNFSEVNV
jgi:hypothetical protein